MRDGSSQPQAQGRLDNELFRTVVDAAPLVSIDLIVENAHGEVLLGRRRNPPAQGSWFVPGGRVRKNETLKKAFARLAQEELGVELNIEAALCVGVFEHFYDTDFAGTADSSTHYVVLAYRLRLDLTRDTLPPAQHEDYRWMQPAKAASDPEVHPNTQAYFQTEQQ
jgi:colanic acid biosynthesis protein WcaH